MVKVVSHICYQFAEKGYNHSSLGTSRLTVGLVCYNHHVNITENLKNEITYQK